jgi:translation initiation factor 1
MMRLSRKTISVRLSLCGFRSLTADIRIQQRNGRKTLTTVQGLPVEFDQKRILKALKKDFACNGTIVKDAEMGEVIQLQGDQRLKVSEFLTSELPIPKKSIKIHG